MVTKVGCGLPGHDSVPGEALFSTLAVFSRPDVISKPGSALLTRLCSLNAPYLNLADHRFTMRKPGGFLDRC